MSKDAGSSMTVNEKAVMDKYRKEFKKEFSDATLKALITRGMIPNLLEGMKDFKEKNGLESLKNTLKYKFEMKGRRDIIDIFESYLIKGLPDKEQYLRDMETLRNIYPNPQQIQVPDRYDNINKYLKGEYIPPVAPPSMTPEEEIESGKMIKDEKRDKMFQEEVKKQFEKDREKMEKENMAKNDKEEMEEIDISTNPNADPSSSSSSTSIPMPVPQSKKPQAISSEIGSEEESHTMPDGTKMSGKSHSKDSKPIKRESQPFVLPTKIDSIPPARLSSSFKDVEDLNDDIKYFFKNFGNLLKTEKGVYKKIKKSDKPNLIKLHSRIVGKLSPKIPDDRSRGKKVGVVIDAQDYIRQEMKRLMENNTFNNMTPGDVVVDVGYNEESGDPDVKDYGDFEVKRNAEGGLSSRREGIYRYAPTEGKIDVGLEDVPERKKRKPRRLANIPLKEINEATTAKRMVKRNPFARNVKTLKLKYLY